MNQRRYRPMVRKDRLLQHVAWHLLALMGSVALLLPLLPYLSHLLDSPIMQVARTIGERDFRSFIEPPQISWAFFPIVLILVMAELIIQRIKPRRWILFSPLFSLLCFELTVMYCFVADFDAFTRRWSVAVYLAIKLSSLYALFGLLYWPLFASLTNFLKASQTGSNNNISEIT